MGSHHVQNGQAFSLRLAILYSNSLFSVMIPCLEAEVNNYILRGERGIVLSASLFQSV